MAGWSWPEFLVAGIAAGVAVAAPVGPMSLLCMRRTLVSGWRRGFVSGLGVASADLLHAALAAAAVGLAGVLLAHSSLLQVAAGLVLGAMGLRGLLKPVALATGAEPATTGRLLRDYAGSFALTLVNPATIVSFGALMAGIGAGRIPDATAAVAAAAGAGIGSALWWAALLGALAAGRRRLGGVAIERIDRASAAVLVVAGAAAVAAGILSR